MERIITVGKSDDIIIKELGFDFVEMPTISTDEELNDFIENKLSKIAFDALIIPLYKEDATIALRLGLHIRLTESLWQKRLATLMFVSTETLATITRDSGIYGHILATKGCKFEQIRSIEMIKRAINSIEPLLIDDFKRKFLNIIAIQPDETVGRHSLANQWGALALDKAANTKSLKSDSELQKAQKQLYFKYITALHSLKSPNKQSDESSQSEKPDEINALNKRILLIDDEADKGWASVLKNIFKVSNQNDFVVIQEKVKDYDSFSETNQKIIQDGNFDLFLIDLRLNGIEEEEINRPEKFSGTKVLQAIKKQNEGNQIIIFTASNKAWNMKKLLDLGADGYYIKESPEYNFPFAFTKENYGNFKDEINVCLDAQYLRKVFSDKRTIDSHLKSIITIGGGKGLESLNKLKMINEICEIQLPQSVALLSLAKRDEKYFVFAFLSYFKILEILNDYFIEYDEIQRVMKFKDNGSILNEYKYDFHSKKYIKQSKNYWDPYKTSTPTKLYNVAYEKLGFHPQSDFKIGQLIYKNNKKRNDFIHPPDGLKSTQVFTKDDCTDISDLIKNIIVKLS
jgi:DNA-binding NarL/FixJ family response regulator